MQIEEIFYSVFWISAISIIWFYTDWVDYYLQLLGIFKNFRLRYKAFVVDNPNSYFPDFLYKLSLRVENRVAKFLLKLVSCPFCLIFWLSSASGMICSNLLIVAPVYVLSMFILLQIKKMI